MSGQGPKVELHQPPVRCEDEPGGTLTVVWSFDGETNAHWRNLFAEAMERYIGVHHPGRPSHARVTEEGILLSGVPEGGQDRAWEIVVSAVGQANAQFDDHHGE